MGPCKAIVEACILLSALGSELGRLILRGLVNAGQMVGFVVALLIPGSPWFTPIAVIAKLVDIIVIDLIRLIPTDAIRKQALGLVLVRSVVGCFARVVILVEDGGRVLRARLDLGRAMQAGFDGGPLLGLSFLVSYLRHHLPLKLLLVGLSVEANFRTPAL